MAESRDHRSSSQEPPPKFLRCSHLCRRGDNHEKCQQCRFNDGLHECTRKTPCQVCKAWIPEKCVAHEKALQQKLKRKAASATKKMQESTMDDSIELHAPEDTLCGPTEKCLTSRLGRSPSPARVQPRVVIPAVFNQRLSALPSPTVNPGLGRSLIAIDIDHRMNTGIGITTAVPKDMDPRRNVSISPDAMRAVSGYAQLQLRAGPARGTSPSALLIRRVYGGQLSSHGLGTGSGVQRSIW